MDTEIVKTLVFAVAFSTLVVIAYHFIMKHLREREMMKVLAETLLKNNDDYIEQAQRHTKSKVTQRRRYTEVEDNMILESPFRDHVIAEKLGRTVPAIHVRRYTLKKNGDK